MTTETRRHPYPGREATLDAILTALPKKIGVENDRATALIYKGLDLAKTMEWPVRRKFANSLWKIFGEKAAADPNFIIEKIAIQADGYQAVSLHFMQVNRPVSDRRHHTSILFVSNDGRGTVQIFPKPFLGITSTRTQRLASIAGSLFTDGITQIEAAQQIKAITGEHCRVLGHGPGTAP